MPITDEQLAAAIADRKRRQALGHTMFVLLAPGVIIDEVLEELVATRKQRDALATNDHPNWARLLAAVGGDASFGRGRIVEAVEKMRATLDALNLQDHAWGAKLQERKTIVDWLRRSGHTATALAIEHNAHRSYR